VALIAMTTADTVNYVSDMDPCKVTTKVPRDPVDAAKGMEDVVTIKEGATVFKLRPLDVFLMGYIYDNASTLSGKSGSDDIGIHTRVNQTNIDCVRHGLADAVNFTDPKGGEVKMKTQKAIVNGRSYDVAHDDIMNMMGVKLIQELAEQVKKGSEVSPSETKNSVEA
jgi:hypothetical protein